MLAALLAATISIAPMVAQAQSTDSQDRKLAELQAKIDKLEARVAELEKQLAEVSKSTATAEAARGEAQKQQLQAKARARIRKDRDKYTPQQIQEAEQIYQTANKNWRSPEAKAALEQLVERFPDLDRTGCAVLYLGQMSDGPEKEQLLKDAIEKHGDCFYMNGVQVGAFGRYLLGSYYKEKGDNDKAAEIFEQLKKNYPDSVDHHGRPLVSMIPNS
jgi:TolA-binding protein